MCGRDVLCSATPTLHTTGLNLSVNTVLTSERERKKAKETSKKEESSQVMETEVQCDEVENKGCFQDACKAKIKVRDVMEWERMEGGGRGCTVF